MASDFQKYFNFSKIWVSSGNHHSFTMLRFAFTILCGWSIAVTGTVTLKHTVIPEKYSHCPQLIYFLVLFNQARFVLVLYRKVS